MKRRLPKSIGDYKEYVIKYKRLKDGTFGNIHWMAKSPPEAIREFQDEYPMLKVVSCQQKH